MRWRTRGAFGNHSPKSATSRPCRPSAFGPPAAPGTIADVGGTKAALPDRRERARAGADDDRAHGLRGRRAPRPWPPPFAKPRYMPSVVKENTGSPERSSTITPPVPAEGGHLRERLVGGRLGREAPVLHERGDVVGGRRAQEHLARARGRDGHARVLRPGARADEGESPTRPKRLSAMPPVEVAAARLPAWSSATAPTVPSLPSSFARRNWRQRSSVRKYEGSTIASPCSFANRSAPRPASRTWRDFSITARAASTGFLTVGHARHGARPQRRPVHDRGVELVRALAREDRALARVEVRRILQDPHRGRHRVEARAAAGQDALARLQRLDERGAVGALALRREGGPRHGARPAVDGDGEGRLRGLPPRAKAQAAERGGESLHGLLPRGSARF